MKNKKGFTLIELLAVIVILGLLMAIAIPSVTKYITQSRKKTLVSTIGNYISALTNQVNDMEYIFTEDNTVYAVPIECIALERGGTNPFGEWMQANKSYWAYVLVQYDDSTSSYTYGFTFKDSAGYGLYPTTSEKLQESGKQIQQDLSLIRPSSGLAVDYVEASKWTGFNIKPTTTLIVLSAESEGTNGDGKKTCTLCQKGDNYEAVEQEKAENKPCTATGTTKGSEVKCGTESFYLAEINGGLEFMLIPKYPVDLTTFKQNSSATGGNYATVINTTNDGKYKAYIENNSGAWVTRVVPIASSGLTNAFGCSTTENSCNTSYSWIYSFDYWLKDPAPQLMGGYSINSTNACFTPARGTTLLKYRPVVGIHRSTIKIN